MERLLEYKIGVAQIGQSDDPEANAGSISRILSQSDANIICFPETSLSGLDQKTYKTPFHKTIAEQAQRFNKWVVYGSYGQRDGLIYNEAYIVDKNGQRRLTYQKQHLWNEPGVQPGTQSPVVKTEFGNLGLIICWDIAHPESIRKLVRQNAEIVFCPSYWFGEAYKTTSVIDSLPLTRAFENQVYLAYCDAFTQNKETAARSKICSPLEVLAAARVQSEDIITATIKLNELTAMRQQFDCWQTRD